MSLIDKVRDMTFDEEISGWSDLHIQEGETLAFRNSSGSISKEEYNGSNLITIKDIEELVAPSFIDDDSDVSEFSLKKLMKSKDGDIDFALGIDGEGGKEKRFRCNLHFFRGRQVGLIMRKINDGAPDISTLGLPELARTFSGKSAGLILVTGPTGSGKSTTLASIIEEINANRNEHIVTVEDPIEYIFESKKCRITQREVGQGKDSQTFSKALRAALRQDPDIILVGEIRDSETANMALEASQTGHLVLGTLHTKSAVSTINRFIQMFAAGDRGRVRDVLADSLIGIISQILVPKIGGGKVLACEVMGVTNAIRSCIRDEEKQAEIVHYIENGQRETGMIRLNDYLLNLVMDKMITPEDAINFCVDLKNMEKKLQAKRINVKTDSELDGLSSTDSENVKNKNPLQQPLNKEKVGVKPLEEKSNKKIENRGNKIEKEEKKGRLGKIFK